MKYIRGFNENSEEDIEFNSEDCFDFMASDSDESKIEFKDIQKNFIYVEYNMSISEYQKLKNYININPRFYNAILVSQYDFSSYGYSGLGIFLVVDRFFYSRNHKYLVNSLDWVPHFLSYEKELNMFKDAKMVNLPDGFTLIKGLNYNKSIEFWPKKFVNEPIEIDLEYTTYFQYLLFKYLGS